MLYKNLDFLELVWKLPLRMLVLDVIALLKSLMEGKWKKHGPSFVPIGYFFYWSWPRQVYKETRPGNVSAPCNWVLQGERIRLLQGKHSLAAFHQKKDHYSDLY